MQPVKSARLRLRRQRDRFRQRWHRRLLQPLAVPAFHKLWYHSADTWQANTWRGWPCAKCPMDLWIYQEILHETRPEVVVECGTFRGGSALWLADMLDLTGGGEVVTIDIDGRTDRPDDPRITYLTGSTTDPAIVARVAEVVAGRRCMVVLDSDHSEAHVRAELAAYANLVTPGCYLVVEDSNVNGHPAARWHGPGPYEAVVDFLAADERFTADRDRERMMMTFNPMGYLRRS